MKLFSRVSARHWAVVCSGITLLSGLSAHAGNVITVLPGNDLQAALNIAMPGDTIVLEAGAIYTGSFYLRNHGGSEPVTIRTSALDSLPPSGTRVTPAHAPFMAKLVSTLGNSVLTAYGAHNYKIIGVEIAPAPGVYSWSLVDIGPYNAKTTSELSSNIEFDRVYIHGDPAIGAKRGVTLNGKAISVRDSWISDIKSTTNETQTLMGWNGPGPFTIVNNYLEASGENIMFGGALPTIANMVPCDIEIRGNYLFKPLSWNVSHSSYAGTKWVVKNLLELKNACRVRISENVFENNWVESQTGFAVVFTPRTEGGKMPWAVVQDVAFTSNVIRNSPSGFTILGQDGTLGGKLSRVSITNNFLDEVGWTKLFGIYINAASVTIDHNTSLAQKHSIIFAEGAPMTNFIFTNNLFHHGTYGIVGTATPTGFGTLNTYFPSAQVVRNVFIGGSSTKYPANNFFPQAISEIGFADSLLPDYSLSAASAYKNAATDGKDIGADITQLRAIEAAVKSGAISSATARVDIAVSAMSVYPTAMSGGVPATVKITLAAPAPRGGANIILSSSNPVAWVPASITVPEGMSSAVVSVQTTPVRTSTPATITAGSKTAAITVNPPVLYHLVMYPTTIVGGTKPVSQHRVVLSGPAPQGGMEVSLSSSKSTLAWVGSSITVPAGSTTGYFLIGTTTPVSTATSVTITAKLGDVVRTAAITIVPPVLSFVTIYPGSLVGGTTSTSNAVKFQGPVAGPAVVSLVSSNPAAASVPATVTVPAGMSSVAFSITSKAVTTNTTVTITASHKGVTRTAKLNVVVR